MPTAPVPAYPSSTNAPAIRLGEDVEQRLPQPIGRRAQPLPRRRPQPPSLQRAGDDSHVPPYPTLIRPNWRDHRVLTNDSRRVGLRAAAPPSTRAPPRRRLNHQVAVARQVAHPERRHARPAACRPRRRRRAARGPSRRSRTRRSSPRSPRAAPPPPPTAAAGTAGRSTTGARPRPTRPRSWCSCERPNRSACSTTITVTFGTSIPTSMTVVATSTWMSPAANRRITSSLACGVIRPCSRPTR